VSIYAEKKGKGSGVDFLAGANSMTGQSRKFSPPSEGITYAINGRISACLRKNIACVSIRGFGRAESAAKRSRLCVSLAGHVITASFVSRLVGRSCEWRRGQSGGRVRTGGSCGGDRRGCRGWLPSLRRRRNESWRARVNVTGLGVGMRAQHRIEGRTSRESPFCTCAYAVLLASPTNLIDRRSRMFRSPVAADPPFSTNVEPAEQGGNHGCHLIPLSVLELDLAAPPLGWNVYLAGRGIAVVDDDIGRPAVARADARMLIAEQREAEVRRREKAAELEQQAVEADQRRRAQIWRGVPAGLLPADVHPARAMLEASRDARRPRRVSPLQEALSGEGMTSIPSAMCRRMSES
jgi:hypothetical protein